MLLLCTPTKRGVSIVILCMYSIQNLADPDADFVLDEETQNCISQVIKGFSKGSIM